MSPLRFGIVGTGFIAGAFARALNDTDAGTLVAVASRDPRRAEQFAQRHGADRGWGTYEALFDSGGVDAVFVATPTLTKIGLAERALAAGLHVLIDKPFPNADELGPLIEQARTRQRVLMDLSLIHI